MNTGKPFETHFWTPTKPGGEVFLFVNDSLLGPLPYVTDMPSCNRPASKERTLFVSLNSGRHEIAVKTKEGKILFEEVLRLKNSLNDVTISSSTHKQQSRSKIVHEGNCLIEQIILE